MVPPYSIRIPRVPTYSSWLTSLVFQIRDFHPLRFGFPTNSSIRQLDVSLWAVPLSLAATHRISFDFFSSGYWDVSLPQVRFIHLCIQWMISKEQMTKDFLDNNFIWSYEARFHYCLLSSVFRPLEGFPHSDIFGSTLVCQLPEAFRKLLRPSSPPTAKASTVCAYLLDHTTLNGFFDLSSLVSSSDLDIFQHRDLRSPYNTQIK